MKKEPHILIDHILESILLLEQYTKRKIRKDFFHSASLQDQVVRRLEVIGEAVKNLPNQFKKEAPSIPWKKMAGMRDVLIYEYFAIDFDLVWQVVKKDIPPLKKCLVQYRRKIEKSKKRKSP